MKLVRFGNKGAERPGVLDREGRIRDLAGHLPDISPRVLDAATLRRLRALDIEKLPVVTAVPRLGPCVTGVGKIICIGLNYRDHAAEAGMAVPAEPLVFFKATTAICGPNDDMILPRGGEKCDWEVELGVVIGSRTSYVSLEQAMEHVAGYCIVNDISERAFQLERGGQFVKGKSCDTFAPLGPWLVTRDEIPDPQSLKMSLDVSGKRRQDSSTQSMVFGVQFLVSYLSQFMTLEPGDIISTGTPSGVGMGCKPPAYLKEGDVMEVQIEGLGVQRQRVVAPR